MTLILITHWLLVIVGIFCTEFAIAYPSLNQYSKQNHYKIQQYELKNSRNQGTPLKNLLASDLITSKQIIERWPPLQATINNDVPYVIKISRLNNNYNDNYTEIYLNLKKKDSLNENYNMSGIYQSKIKSDWTKHNSTKVNINNNFVDDNIKKNIQFFNIPKGDLENNLHKRSNVLLNNLFFTKENEAEEKQVSVITLQELLKHWGIDTSNKKPAAHLQRGDIEVTEKIPSKSDSFSVRGDVPALVLYNASVIKSQKQKRDVISTGRKLLWAHETPQADTWGFSKIDGLRSKKQANYDISETYKTNKREYIQGNDYKNFHSKNNNVYNDSSLRIIREKQRIEEEKRIKWEENERRRDEERRRRIDEEQRINDEEQRRNDEKQRRDHEERRKNDEERQRNEEERRRYNEKQQNLEDEQRINDEKQRRDHEERRKNYEERQRNEEERRRYNEKQQKPEDEQRINDEKIRRDHEERQRNEEERRRYNEKQQKPEDEQRINDEKQRRDYEERRKNYEERQRNEEERRRYNEKQQKPEDEQRINDEKIRRDHEERQRNEEERRRYNEKQQKPEDEQRINDEKQRRDHEERRKNYEERQRNEEERRRYNEKQQKPEDEQRINDEKIRKDHEERQRNEEERRRYNEKQQNLEDEQRINDEKQRRDHEERRKNDEERQRNEEERRRYNEKQQNLEDEQRINDEKQRRDHEERQRNEEERRRNNKKQQNLVDEQRINEDGRERINNELQNYEKQRLNHDFNIREGSVQPIIDEHDTYNARISEWQRMKDNYDQLIHDKEKNRNQMNNAKSLQELMNERKLQDYIRRNTPIIIGNRVNNNRFQLPENLTMPEEEKRHRLPYNQQTHRRPVLNNKSSNKVDINRNEEKEKIYDNWNKNQSTNKEAAHENEDIRKTEQRKRLMKEQNNLYEDQKRQHNQEFQRNNEHSKNINTENFQRYENYQPEYLHQLDTRIYNQQKSQSKKSEPKETPRQPIRNKVQNHRYDDSHHYIIPNEYNQPQINDHEIFERPTARYPPEEIVIISPWADRSKAETPAEIENRRIEIERNNVEKERHKQNNTLDVKRKGWLPSYEDISKDDQKSPLHEHGRKENETKGRYHEFKENKNSRSQSLTESRRNEEERLRRLPVSATITVRNISRDNKSNINDNTPIQIGFRGDFDDNKIAFQGNNPYSRGIEVPGFQRIPTTRGPPSKPSPNACVWSIVICCSQLNAKHTDRLRLCFEATNCPGANWDTHRCAQENIKAANTEIMQFYLKNQPPASPTTIIF